MLEHIMGACNPRAESSNLTFITFWKVISEGALGHNEWIVRVKQGFLCMVLCKQVK